jgi:hypothetical protein
MTRNVRALTRVATAGTASALFALTVTVAGQTAAPAAGTAKPAAQAGRPAANQKPYVPPRTPWGEPDIQGMFNFSYVGTVPLERCGGGGAGRAPAEYIAKVAPPRGGGPGGPGGGAGRAGAPPAGDGGGRAGAAPGGAARGGAAPGAGGQAAGGRAGAPGGGRAGGRGGAPCDPNVAFKPEEEYQAQLAAALKRSDRATDLIEQGQFGQALQAGVTDPTWPQRQTSLIMDPPDGRLPPLTPEGNRRMMQMKSSWSWFNGEPQEWDHWTDFDHWDRCITRGLPASMGPYRYNNGMRILQAPGYVVLDLEMIHEARIIPTDGRHVNAPTIMQYMGQSRGRWENGNTLVIETDHIKPGASMTNIGVAGSPGGNRIPTSDKLKIVERITATDKGMIEYSITVDDPVIMTRPWTARMPLKDDPTYEWWEYACHEGNTAIPNYINASRAERAARAGGAGPAAQPAAPAGGRGGQ